MTPALPFRPGGWRTIVADFPWRYGDQHTRLAPDGTSRTAAGGYRTMTAAKIRAFPMRDLAAWRSHLYLWVTDGHLELGLECLRLWHFDYKRTLVWVKRGESGKLAFGGGHYYRTAHELCLFATSGGHKARVRTERTVFESPRGLHSEKPDELFRLAERVSSPPRLELFARDLDGKPAQRPGWTCWGDQVGQVAA